MGSCTIPGVGETTPSGGIVHVHASIISCDASERTPKKLRPSWGVLLAVLVAAVLVARFYNSNKESTPTQVSTYSDNYARVLKTIPKWDRVNMENLVEQLALGFRQERALALKPEEAVRCKKCVTLQQIQDYVASYYVEHAAQLALPSSDDLRSLQTLQKKLVSVEESKKEKIERAMKRLALSLRR